MQLIVRFPEIIERYSPNFEDLFTETGYMYFRRYLTGLQISENKTIEGMNRLFVLNARHQSNFNRFVNNSSHDLEKLNNRRLELLSKYSGTCFKSVEGRSGVLGLDNSLLSHYGKKMDNIYRLYNYVDKHYCYAHDLVTLHYSDDKTDYPVYHQLWLPPDWEAVGEKMKALGIHINQTHWDNRHTKVHKFHRYMADRYRDYQYKKPELQKVYKTKIHWGMDLIRKFDENYPNHDFPIALDSGFTTPELCKMVSKELGRNYVGFLPKTRKIPTGGSGEQTLEDFMNALKTQQIEGKKIYFQKTVIPYKGKEEIYYAWAGNKTIPGFGKQRLVISFRKEDLSDSPRYTISNRLDWYARGILRIRRHRWPVETYHQEGKAEGLDKYQLQNFPAILNHIAFTVTAFSMLKCAEHDSDLLSKIQQRLAIEFDSSVTFLRRLMKAEGLFNLMEYLLLQTQRGLSVQQILKPFIAQLAFSGT